MPRALPAERIVTTVFAGVCAYECAAVTSGRLPTVSQLCRRRRWVEAGLLACLLVHLHAGARAVSASPREAARRT